MKTKNNDKKRTLIPSVQLVPGMTVEIGNKIYRIESSVKVTAARGAAFIKVNLRELLTDKVFEKNFKPEQEIEEVTMQEKIIVYLYLENKKYVFLDIEELTQIHLDQTIISDKADYLKEGIELKASFYGDTVFAVELPQFLELTVMKTQEPQEMGLMGASLKLAHLETGAKVEVPLFVEVGDIIKIDTVSGEFVQRV
ncbi:MAG: Elongation factor P [Chlamydiae bacterium]|nr:Elongation factor P [Chlamydiota bacterium]